MSVERTCVECEWWDAITTYKDKRNSGYCRLLPPRNNGGDEDEYLWPKTFDEDWCGRWQPKEEK